MRQVRRQVEPVSRPQLDRLGTGGDPQITLHHPARFGKRVLVLRHARAREIRPPRGDHPFALEREGMVTAWWSDLPGARMTEHEHAFPETRWVVEGYLRITAGAEAVELGPGDRLDLPPNLPHTIEVLGLAQVIYVSGTMDKQA